MAQEACLCAMILSSPSSIRCPNNKSNRTRVANHLLEGGRERIIVHERSTSHPSNIRTWQPPPPLKLVADSSHMTPTETDPGPLKPTLMCRMNRQHKNKLGTTCYCKAHLCWMPREACLCTMILSPPPLALSPLPY